ncbi:MAG TPA: hypothetical protein VGD43_19560, partial [Micromonospora sp.]
MDRREVLRAALAAGAVTLGAAVAESARAADGRKTAPGRDIRYRQWTTTADFTTGTLAGVSVTGDAIGIATPVGQL